MSVRRPQRRLAPAAALLMTVAAVAAPTASADVGQTIIRRCAEGKPLGGFTQADYRRALKEMSATTEEYSPCGEEIRKAQEAAAAGHGGTAGAAAAGATPIAANPAERRSLAGAATAGGAPVRLGGQVVHPGVVHANIASAFSKLPDSVLAILAFLLASALTVGGTLLRRRFGGGRTD